MAIHKVQQHGLGTGTSTAGHRAVRPRQLLKSEQMQHGPEFE